MQIIMSEINGKVTNNFTKPSSPNEVGHYVVTGHRPGGVIVSTKCSFLGPNSMVRLVLLLLLLWSLLPLQFFTIISIDVVIRVSLAIICNRFEFVSLFPAACALNLWPFTFHALLTLFVSF